MKGAPFGKGGRAGRPWLGIMAAAAVFAVTAAAAAAEVDHSAFGSLLREHLHGSLADYDGFKRDEALLDTYLDHLAAVEVGQLPANEQFAFYVNAYNAWTIKLILTGWPGVESIKELGSLFRSPWKKNFVRLRSGMVSLDHIEHEILRPRFQDPRVHFAVNCASIGCPPLYPEPFTAERLDAQLDDATRSFINDPGYNRLENGTLFVSSIFKWYAEDFEGGVLPFFLKYADGPLREALEARKESIVIDYLDYDWSLNAWREGGGSK
ncbi:MAG: DUF547 domain-containing protein [Desulfobacterales bacterium]